LSLHQNVQQNQVWFVHKEEALNACSLLGQILSLTLWIQA